ncbi:precorrin-6A synthase (deacetylating) [Paracoccus sp. Z330]|uniref:Precorrin-6A synthase [deacetylating] n=1 Tax=Paracoccus onchidii TaxID=3017813 RepID=A0ABT4ZEN1_9RHOB|nr:precorrin-6A synthase (deacetylating) [Paracoccus onchidii]MDB6177135.1 precorrin-6A synthase (deacetylating) [Paracoccus onchidii]
MIELSLVGIGTGNPRHLSLQAIDAIQAADLILIPLKGAEKQDLADLRQAMCRAYALPSCKIAAFPLPRRDTGTDSYRKAVDDWHDAIATCWHDQIRANLPRGGKVVFLIWGDPSLYDSSLRIADRLESKLSIRRQVIPGITAIQALCAAHAITLNTIGEPVHITTGRDLRDQGWPAQTNTAVVMLDGGNAFLTLPPDRVHIWWGAFLGMPEQVLLSGPLDRIGPQIAETRAKARAAHGWIMDVYLLRRQ